MPKTRLTFEKLDPRTKSHSAASLRRHAKVGGVVRDRESGKVKFVCVSPTAARRLTALLDRGKRDRDEVEELERERQALDDELAYERQRATNLEICMKNAKVPLPGTETGPDPDATRHGENALAVLQRVAVPHRPLQGGIPGLGKRR